MFYSKYVDTEQTRRYNTNIDGKQTQEGGEIMTDSEKFKCCMREHGYTVKTLAEKIGISHEALYQKIANERSFKASEIMAISDAMGMTVADRDSIFFARNVCLQQSAQKEVIHDVIPETPRGDYRAGDEPSRICG